MNIRIGFCLGMLTSVYSAHLFAAPSSLLAPQCSSILMSKTEEAQGSTSAGESREKTVGTATAESIIIDIKFAIESANIEKSRIEGQIRELNQRIDAIQTTPVKVSERMKSFIKREDTEKLQMTKFQELMGQVHDLDRQKLKISSELVKTQKALKESLAPKLEKSLRENILQVIADPSDLAEFEFKSVGEFVQTSAEKLGITAKVQDAQTGKDFEFIYIVDNKNAEWHGLLDQQVFKTQPDYYLELKHGTALDRVSFKPVANSKLGVVLASSGLHFSPGVLDRLAYEYERKDITEKQVRDLIAFRYLNILNHKPVNDALYESFITLMALHPDVFLDSQIPTRLMLYAATLPAKIQADIIKFNSAAAGVVRRTSELMSFEQYMNFMKKSFPSLHHELSLSLAVESAAAPTKKELIANFNGLNAFVLNKILNTFLGGRDTITESTLSKYLRISAEDIFDPRPELSFASTGLSKPTQPIPSQPKGAAVPRSSEDLDFW